MNNTSNLYDVIIIGGGPAGATAAALLAEQNKRVLVVEKSNFPRFHVGESLLPATMRIFKRLGVLQQLEEQFIQKPGGKMMFGETPLLFSFTNTAEKYSYADNPYSYMVKRSEFDRILLNRAEELGAKVLYNTKVEELLWRNDRVSGVKIQTREEITDKHAKLVLDCSGQSAVISRNLDLRETNSLRRMSCFGHFRCQYEDPQLKEGSLVVQIIEDGWLWLIPIEKDLVSVGAVVALEHFKKAKEDPENFLLNLMNSTEFLKTTLKDAKLVDQVSSIGNLGYSSKKFAGEGWVLVGDAAFFIDPIFSSGVHIAMDSAEMLADQINALLDENKEILPSDFRKYEKKMRSHEKVVLSLVESYYLTTKNKTLMKLWPSFDEKSYFRKKFAPFLAGEFGENHLQVKTSAFFAKAIATVCP